VQILVWIGLMACRLVPLIGRRRRHQRWNELNARHDRTM